MAFTAKRAAPDRYSRLQVVLHWATAALVLLQLLVNADMRRAFRAQLEMGDGAMSRGAGIHIASGLLILGLVLVRLAIRFAHGAPPPVEGTPPAFKLLGLLVHVALYVLLVLMAVSGMLAWFGGIEAAAVLHEAGRLLLISAILAHVLGALVENFVFGNRIMRRMMVGR